MKQILYILILFIGFSTYSQRKKKEIIIDDKILIEGDSIEFSLDEVTLLKKLKLKSKKERNYYYWYRKKIHKAYPYALLTASTLNEVDTQLKKIKSKRKRKKYIKKAQKLLNEEFKAQLKKLTRTEGKLLIRLVHRQTGSSVFDLIKKYRSGWKAFWYNSTANVFGMSLKTEYHPESRELDFLVEDILQRAFINGSLKKTKSKLKFDYMSLATKHKNMDIVKLIDER
jgi:hypothetical protein